jgi:hypothetical protein
MQIIFHCVKRPFGIFVIISTIKLLSDEKKKDEKKNDELNFGGEYVFLSLLTLISTDHKFPLNPM